MGRGALAAALGFGAGGRAWPFLAAGFSGGGALAAAASFSAACAAASRAMGSR